MAVFSEFHIWITEVNLKAEMISEDPLHAGRLTLAAMIRGSDGLMEGLGAEDFDELRSLAFQLEDPARAGAALDAIWKKTRTMQNENGHAEFQRWIGGVR